MIELTISVESELWPNFFIVGAMKAGTTSLYSYLKEVEDIYMSPIKEPNYFASMDIPANSFRKVIRDKEQYLSLFKNANNAMAIGEASTDYLYSSNAACAIQKTNPDSKIIILLRDPIERAFSHYLSNVKYKQFNIHNMTFYEAIYKDYNRADKGIGRSLLYVECGLYFEKVKHYFELFGRNNVLIMFFEEFVLNTVNGVMDVLNFLDVESEIPNNIHNTYNSYFIPKNRIGRFIVSNKKSASMAKHIPEFLKGNLRKYFVTSSITKPAIPPDAKSYLFDLFFDDVSNLRKLLQRDLPWVNFQ